ncbi:CYFA0S02e01310g1_1 [Cyberlindnera fabianii]|uniref:CYFA0S02e01310g1_1 n=1 Tax=Cyberlindnera fabianii TaxID=36022 RepID=A0A061AMN6_CYBFA|nr:CYFA0S02e01310g1_1 [Cyberlindnera fabianii]
MSIPTHNAAPETTTVIVRFSTAQYPDLPLPPVLLPQLTLSWLRKNVRSKLPDLTRRRLRFINSGRVITDATNLTEEYRRLTRFNRGSEQDETEPPKFYIHCLIGDDLTPEELQKENELDNLVQQQSTTPAPVGFDRLASAGFSQEEINALRQQFQQLYGDLPQGENTDIRQLEERWIDSSVNNEVDEFNGANAGSSALGGNEDLLLGALIGCLLGVLALFLIKEEALFSRRQKMAVIAGFMVNFSFALIRQWN